MAHKRNDAAIIDVAIAGLCIITAAMLMICVMESYVEAKQYKYPLGDIPLSAEEYQKHLKKIPKDMAASEMALPLAYDARDDGIVTPPRDQGSCGSCWAFASVAALESHLLAAGIPVSSPDLSEQQQVSCNTSMLGCSGGNANAFLFWTDKGPQDESDFYYTANDATPCVTENQLGYRITDYHTVPATTAGFKESLFSDGPSYWRYTVHSDFLTYWNQSGPDTVYVNQASSVEGGHAVLLIGWDDTKNAFLCKNSWGSGGPNDDGTFWIAYSGHASNLGFGMANFSVISLTCGSDAECDDGDDCNGIETCVSSACQPGTAVVCNDDGNFCNGIEQCVDGGCISTGSQCAADEVCDEYYDECRLASCGNGMCDEAEDCINCSEDCISGSGSGDCGSCFKGKCDGVCHAKKEDASCSDCAVPYCCGDAVCNGDEDSYNCETDCDAPPAVEICNNSLDDDEDGLSDCDDPDCSDDSACDEPSELEICDNSVDDDADGLSDCDDPDCSDDPACQSSCSPRKTPCSSNDECCSAKCFRGKCK